eukprot:scaffold5777_cov101-Isochrysis_galbana.AAC.1
MGLLPRRPRPGPCCIHALTCQSIIVSSLFTPDSTRGVPVNAPSPIDPCTQIRVFSPRAWHPSATSRASSSRVPTR